MDVVEPTDFPAPDLEPCATCAAGDLCVAHTSLFSELADLPGLPAPAGWGKVRPTLARAQGARR